MATERAGNGGASVDAVLAALRRAAEQDGVDDVDAVVAEFATFVRAQAPRLASGRPSRRSSGPTARWRTTAFALGSIAAAAVGAVAAGVVANPFLGPAVTATADASDGAPGGAAASDGGGGAAGGAALPTVGGGGSPAGAGAPDSGDALGEAEANTPPVELVASETMTFTDPDAIAVASQGPLATAAPAAASPATTAPAVPAPAPPATDDDSTTTTTTISTTPTTTAAAPGAPDGADTDVEQPHTGDADGPAPEPGETPDLETDELEGMG